MTLNRRRFLQKTALASGSTLFAAATLHQTAPYLWPGPRILDQNRSFWAASQPPLNPPLRENLVVDVAVIGGGFTGLSAAYFIRSNSPNKKVVLLEGRGCGNGASGRNGAMVLTMTEDRYLNFSSHPLLDKEIYALTAANIQWLSNLSMRTGIDCQLQTDGALQVLANESEVQQAKEYVRQARSLGMPVEFWDKSQVVTALGTEIYEGAFFDPSGGQVHPMKLVHVFKVAAQNVGALIYENTLVDRIEEGKKHVLYVSDGHTITANSIVLATNAYTPDLGFLKNAVLPVHEYVAMTRP